MKIIFFILYFIILFNQNFHLNAIQNKKPILTQNDIPSFPRDDLSPDILDKFLDNTFDNELNKNDYGRYYDVFVDDRIFRKFYKKYKPGNNNEMTKEELLLLEKATYYDNNIIDNQNSLTTRTRIMVHTTNN